MNPLFEYRNPQVDASKLAYDLAMVYAKAKFDEMLRTDPDYFQYKPAPAEIEEIAFIEQAFMKAYRFYMGSEPRELERSFEEAYGWQIRT